MKPKPPKPKRARLEHHKKRIKRIKKHPFLIPFTTVLGLVIVTAVGYISLNGQTVQPPDSHIIIAQYDGKQQTIPTRAETVGDFLKRANIDIREGDRVEPAQDTEIAEDNFRVNVYRARPVIIFDGGRKVQAFSAATTPRSVAEQVGISVYPEDDVQISPTEDVLRDGIGEQLVIDRATPTNLNLYGTQLTIRTRAKTVGDLLNEKKIKLGEGDSVQPSAETVLTPNTQVFVLRTGTQIVAVEEIVAMPIQHVEDNSLSLGATAIRQKGSPGKKVVTYQLDLENGKEVGRHVIQTVTLSEPVTQIVARGRAVNVPADKEAVMAAAGIAPGDYGFVNYIVSHESGWCPTKLQGQRTCPPYAPGSYPAGVGYGLVQATPGGKMASAGADWETSAVTQLKWASGYARGRYGSWEGAYNFWIAKHYW